MAQDVEAQLKQVQEWQSELEEKRDADIRRAKEEEARRLHEAELNAQVKRKRQRVEAERLATAAAERDMEEKRRARGECIRVWLLPTALTHWNDCRTEDTPWIRHVALCCNDGMMIIYESGSFSFSGIPTALQRRLVGLQSSIGVAFAAFSQSDPTCYFVKLGNGKMWWGGVPIGFVNAINESSFAVSYVAFGASSSSSSCTSSSFHSDSNSDDTSTEPWCRSPQESSQSSWYIKFVDGSSQWVLSSRHSTKIKANPVDFLSLGPSDGMFIRYTNGRYAWIDPPRETQAAFNRHASKGWDMRQVIFGAQGSYVLRYTSASS